VEEAVIVRLDQVRPAARGISVALTSGCFDPLHVGHLQMLHAMSQMAPILVVLVNSDTWIQRYKGHAPFMAAVDRAEILSSLGVVDMVVITDGDPQGTVADAISRIRPAVFAKGGDIQRAEDLPAAERDACQASGCRVAVGVGGEKIRSSSELRAAAAQIKAESIKEPAA
jgi:cytidyltransferase-like protein